MCFFSIESLKQIFLLKSFVFQTKIELICPHCKFLTISYLTFLFSFLFSCFPNKQKYLKSFWFMFTAPMQHTHLDFPFLYLFSLLFLMLALLPFVGLAGFHPRHLCQLSFSHIFFFFSSSLLLLSFITHSSLYSSSSNPLIAAFAFQQSRWRSWFCGDFSVIADLYVFDFYDMCVLYLLYFLV